MSDFDENSLDIKPLDIFEEAEYSGKQILPKRSKDKYEGAYQAFIAWRQSINTESWCESVFLSYFTELAKTLKPSTLWSRYSMLKSTIISNNNIDISRYSKLNAYLKKQSTGFTSQKSKILTLDEITKFLDEAPDYEYLATKVNTIIQFFI